MITKFIDSIYLSLRFWANLPRGIFRLRQAWNSVAALEGADPFRISMSVGVVLWKSRENRDRAVLEGARVGNVQYQISESTFAQLVKDSDFAYNLSIAVASAEKSKPE